MRAQQAKWLSAAFLALAVALSSGCGGSTTGTDAAHQRDRATTEIPPGWNSTTARVSNLIDPKPLLAVGSFDFTPHGGPPPRGGNCLPRGLLRLMPEDGALIVVLAYSRAHLSPSGLRKLPPRPAPLELSRRYRGPHECGGNFDMQFRQGGRGYIVQVWLDPQEVDPRTRRQAEAVLASLDFGSRSNLGAIPEIQAFDATLVSPTAVRVEYRLSRPANLTLLVAGTEEASPSGAIPFDDAGNYPDPIRSPGTSPAGRGRVRVHFERGELNFSGAKRLQFTVVASRDGRRSGSDPITLNRDGLFGRAQVEKAIASVGE